MTISSQLPNLTEEVTKTLPRSLTIPGLTACSAQNSFDAVHNDSRFESIHELDNYSENDFETRIQETDFDIDGGEGDNWCLYSASATATPNMWNQSYDPEESFVDPMLGYHQNYVRDSKSEVLEYCKTFDGATADLAEAIEIFEDKYLYLDWLNCLQIWRSQMSPEMVERIDWANMNPSSYRIKYDGTLELITN